MNKMTILFAISLLMPISSAMAEDYLYILSAHAKIMSEPSFSASAVERATKGEKLVSLKKTNRWFKVNYKGKEGWISRLAVSPHPPMKRVSRLAKAGDTLQNESRRRASSVSTTAAVRGLRGEGRSRLSDANQTDFEALAHVESAKVTDDEALEFLASR